MDIKHFTPTPDWLSISFASSHSPFFDLDILFKQLGVVQHNDLPRRSIYKFLDGGSAHCMLEKDFHSFSFSGSCLESIRRLDLSNDLLSALMLYPSNITRLDIAYDMPVSFPTYYKNLQALYPKGSVEVLGKIRKSQVILSNCPRTNQMTGTYYFQDKNYKGHTKIKVYDKSNEVHSRTGDVIRPTTRIELTLNRSVGLKDFVSPSSAFWHHLPDNLVKTPENVPQFVKTPRLVLTDSSSSELTAFQKFDILIEHSAYLAFIKDNMVGKPLADKRAFRLSLLNYLDLHDPS